MEYYTPEEVGDKLKNKERFDQATRDRAFKLYKKHDGNAAAVARYEGMPTNVTILQWADKYDWDGKLDAAKEEVQRILGNSNDPLIQKLVKDDVFMVEVLALLQGVAMEGFKKNRSKFIPKNPKDLVLMLKFVSAEKEKRMGPAKPAELDKTSLAEALKKLLGEDVDEEVEEGVIVDLRRAARRLKKKSA